MEGELTRVASSLVMQEKCEQTRVRLVTGRRPIKASRINLGPRLCRRLRFYSPQWLYHIEASRCFSQCGSDCLPRSFSLTQLKQLFCSQTIRFFIAEAAALTDALRFAAISQTTCHSTETLSLAAALPDPFRGSNDTPADFINPALASAVLISSIPASLQSIPSRLGSSSSTALLLSRPLLPTKAFLSKSSSLTASNPPGFLTSKSISSMPEMALTAARANRRLGVYETNEKLSVSLARHIADLSKKFAEERGAFTVVLSGGILISALKKLLEPPYFNSIEWEKWHVFWVDERVVPRNHVDSNYKLAFDGFLSKVPIPRDNVHGINDALSPEAAADDYETLLKLLVKSKVVSVSETTGLPKFDLMLLGMGPEGHVASLFPDHPLCKEDKRWVAYITNSPNLPRERITFTFPVINAAANIAMVVTENTTAGAVNKVLGSDRGSAPLPAGMVAPEGEMAWFTSIATAPKLEGLGGFKKAEFEL
ncbi:hypothetical protein ACLOJK_006257 [Asimina triloba]